MALGELVRPLINLTREELIKGYVIHSDERVVQVHKGTGKKPTAKSYMWVFVGELPNGSKIVLYELGSSRSLIVSLRVLEGYKGAEASAALCSLILNPFLYLKAAFTE